MQEAPTIARVTEPPRGQRRPWWLRLAVIVFGAWALLVVVYQVIGFRSYYIPSSAMEPTLMGPATGGVGPGTGGGGDRVRAEMLLSRLRAPRRGEIWTFRAPPQASANESLFVKRVIGTPGETVEVVPPRLLAEGKSLFHLGDVAGVGMTIQGSGASPELQEGGKRAVLTAGYSDGQLLVVANPNPRLEEDPFRVMVNGKTVLEEPGGGIEGVAGFVAYGGAPELKGKVYSVAGEPRLAIVRAKGLTYEPGHVLVDGKPLSELYIKEPPHYGMPPKKLGPDEYFLMGDNRNNSNDSHVWGPLQRDRFEGRIVFRFWPANRIGSL
jgi:signal peptidase I